jgi:hypothetical protein
LNPAFCALDATDDRRSVPPEQLLLASLLQAFYGIRSETFLEKLMAAPEVKSLLSDEHFSVNGTLTPRKGSSPRCGGSA